MGDGELSAGGVLDAMVMRMEVYLVWLTDAVGKLCGIRLGEEPSDFLDAVRSP